MSSTSLHACARSFFKEGKGILAADESTKTMNKRLRSIGVPEEPEMRRKYRQLLFTAPNIEEYLTGTIMYDSSIRNKTDDGTPFVDVLIAKGIIPIIKVDKSTTEHTGFPGEVITEGLDGLFERLEEYYELGARAAKWRAVFSISENTPTEQTILANSFALARYAALCQKANIVPMVEPEVLFKGAHSLQKAEEVTTYVLTKMFEILAWYKTDITGMILKTSMVLAGSEHEKESSPEEVAAATVRVLGSAVPKEVGGVVFLSGGQTWQRATENLNAISNLEPTLPFPTTFSFSRAIEEPILEAWGGKEENIENAQQAMLHRLKMNSLAEKGEYDPSLENG
ncbi:MAG: class I fructose-bisphosphate aldolase [Candidatus Paceibacterota bacterium]